MLAIYQRMAILGGKMDRQNSTADTQTCLHVRKRRVLS